MHLVFSLDRIPDRADFAILCASLRSPSSARIEARRAFQNGRSSELQPGLQTLTSLRKIKTGEVIDAFYVCQTHAPLRFLRSDCLQSLYPRAEECFVLTFTGASS